MHLPFDTAKISLLGVYLLHKHDHVLHEELPSYS